MPHPCRVLCDRACPERSRRGGGFDLRVNFPFPENKFNNVHESHNLSRGLIYDGRMPWGLQRIQQAKCLHFITFSCHNREPLLSAPHSRDIFEQMLEQVRQWYGFFVSGYVVMPEHTFTYWSANRSAVRSRARCKCSSRIRRICFIRPKAAPSGCPVTTISMCGAKTSASRNYVTSIGTQ